MANADSITYDQIVNYEGLDAFKVDAQAAALTTAGNLARFGYSEVTQSRGESAFVWDEGDRYRAGVLEGLGTKNLVADLFDKEQSHYDAIAQDCAAMILNDLYACGADGQLLWVHLAVESDSWFNNQKRAKAFNLGMAAVCNTEGITWGGGETPGLAGIIEPGTAEISGFALGEIRPKEHYISGTELEPGDQIILIESSGIHANGLSTARKLAERLPDGYETDLPDGRKFGEVLLEPTKLYGNAVKALQAAGIKPKRMENITGHGWRKLMRAKEEFTYRIDKLPPAMPIFDFLKHRLIVDDEEMFGNYNMGAGYAVYVRKKDVDPALEAITGEGHEVWHAGGVEEGPKQVIIGPKDLVFTGDTLGVR